MLTVFQNTDRLVVLTAAAVTTFAAVSKLITGGPL
jgi:hypothetical protein